MTGIDLEIPGLCAAGASVVTALGLWIVIRRNRAQFSGEQIALRADLEAQMCEQHAGFTAELARLGERLSVVEQSAKQIAEAKTGLARPVRAQALQMLRAGMSAENTAQALGMCRNETRLLATVSRTLVLK
jgi:hypothetical protein